MRVTDLAASLSTLFLSMALCAQGVNYSGTWAVTPTAQYSCAGGTFTIQVDQVRIVDTYPTL